VPLIVGTISLTREEAKETLVTSPEDQRTLQRVLLLKVEKKVTTFSITAEDNKRG